MKRHTFRSFCLVLTLRDRHRNLPNFEVGGRGTNEVRRSRKLRCARTYDPVRWSSPDTKDPFQQVPAGDDSRGSSSSSAARQDPAGHHQLAPKRLASISGFGPSSSTKDTTAAKRTKPRNAKSAQEIIREAPTSSGIREIGIKPEGGDTPPLPARTSQSPRSPQSSAASPNEMDRIDNRGVPSHPNLHLSRINHNPAPLKFLKPAGVDEPPPEHVVRRVGEHPALQRDADTTDHGTQRRKREREDRRGVSSGGSDGGSGGALTSDRDKKRKKSGAAATTAAAT
jgi:hypothetical protein